MPRFVLKEMESLYIEECRSQINQLMQNLESLPVSKGSTDSKYGLPKLKKYNHRYVNFSYVCLSDLFVQYAKRQACWKTSPKFFAVTELCFDFNLAHIISGEAQC